MLTNEQKLAQSIRARNWYLAHKELVNQRSRERYIANAEEIKAVQREHYHKNKEHKIIVAKKWKEQNKEKLTEYSRKCRYGVTSHQFDSMYSAQEGLCAICGDPLSSPNLDHNHKTKQPRALLCGHCNRGLGHFKDSPELLKKASAYVEHYEQSNQAA